MCNFSFGIISLVFFVELCYYKLGKTNLSGDTMKTLDEIKIGEQGTVVRIGSSGALRRRIIDMGITPGAVVIKRKAAPFGDPIEINVRGYELSIRRSEAKEITLDSITKYKS